MSPFKKAFISPAFTYKCISCDEAIVIDKVRTLIIVFIFIALAKIIAIYANSLLISFTCVLPILLYCYSMFVSFEKSREE